MQLPQRYSDKRPMLKTTLKVLCFTKQGCLCIESTLTLRYQTITTEAMQYPKLLELYIGRVWGWNEDSRNKRTKSEHAGH